MSHLCTASVGLPGGAPGKEPTCQRRRHETWVWFLGWEDLQKEGVATHSRILAWRIPWTKEPGGLQAIRLQRIGQDWSDSACTHTHSFCTWTHVSLPLLRPHSSCQVLLLGLPQTLSYCPFHTPGCSDANFICDSPAEDPFMVHAFRVKSKLSVPCVSLYGVWSLLI